jgi:hypothetical protein
MGLSIRQLERRVVALEELTRRAHDPLNVRVRMNFVDSADEAPRPLTQKEPQLIGQQQRGTARDGIERG